MRETGPDLEVGDSVPEPIVTETTTCFERYALDDEPTRIALPIVGEDDVPPPLPLPPPLFARLGSSNDRDEDDEPPPLPPVPARGSQQYAVPRVTVLSRVIVPRMRPRPVPRRAESCMPPIELDAEYEALLRALG